MQHVSSITPEQAAITVSEISVTKIRQLFYTDVSAISVTYYLSAFWLNLQLMFAFKGVPY